MKDYKYSTLEAREDGIYHLYSNSPPAVEAEKRLDDETPPFWSKMTAAARNLYVKGIIEILKGPPFNKKTIVVQTV